MKTLFGIIGKVFLSIGKKVKEDFSKKDTSTLIGQLLGIGLLIIISLTVVSNEPDVKGIKGKLLGFSIVIAAMALGWAVGILVSPLSEYNDEKTNFTKIQQVIGTLITGALAAKLLPLITGPNIEKLFNDLPLLLRVLYFIASFVISAIVVYYDRVYLNDQDLSKFSCHLKHLKSNSTFLIPLVSINDNPTIKIYNRGKSSLGITRGNSDGSNNEPKAIASNDFRTFSLEELGKDGNFLLISNNSAELSGRFKLRII